MTDWQRAAQRRLAEQIERELYGRSTGVFYTGTTPQPQPPATYEGLMYQLAVMQQDLDENPLLTTIRGEPGTVIRFMHALPAEVKETFVFSWSGVRVEEDHDLPPRPPGVLDLFDHRGRLMGQVVL